MRTLYGSDPAVRERERELSTKVISSPYIDFLQPPFDKKLIRPMHFVTC